MGHFLPNGRYQSRSCLKFYQDTVIKDETFVVTKEEELSGCQICSFQKNFHKEQFFKTSQFEF